MARAGNLSDGELRPLPVLPSRIHLAQSRFATLKGGERRELTFDDMKSDDPTRIDEQMVVTVDGQLFYSMLDALPYLVEYPYECTEQTLNRFVSTGILVEPLRRSTRRWRGWRRSWPKRETPLERFDAGRSEPQDGARGDALAARVARRATKTGQTALLRVLDPAVARAQRDDALAKLAQGAAPERRLPLVPGRAAVALHDALPAWAASRAPPSSRSRCPREMVAARLAATSRGEIERDWLPNAIARRLLLGAPDLPQLRRLVVPRLRRGWATPSRPRERTEILDFSFKHWKQHAPQLKLQLALDARSAWTARRTRGWCSTA